MKKNLFILSLVFITIWIAGAFFLGAPRLIHAMLPVSILCYLRALMTPDPRPSA